MPNVLLKAMRDMRWALFWYGAGLAAIAALVVWIYPSYAGQLEGFEIPDALKALIGDVDYASPEGFVSAEFFSQWVTVVLVVFAVMQGTSALAGEEVNGTLELLLAAPISRTRLALEKLLAFTFGTVVLALLITTGWFLSIPFVAIDLPLWKPVFATFNLIPFTLAMGTLSMFAGAALPSRALATGFVAALAVATFVLNALGLLVDVIAPLRWLTPFHYYGGSEILTKGVFWEGTLTLLGSAALFALLTVLTFNRREVGVSASMGFRDLLRLLRRRVQTAEATASSA